jgi:hypothetical protein
MEPLYASWDCVYPAIVGKFAQKYEAAHKAGDTTICTVVSSNKYIDISCQPMSDMTHNMTYALAAAIILMWILSGIRAVCKK